MTKYIAGLILLAGLAIRLPGIPEPLLGFHPTRQYRSAILARSYAVDHLALSDTQRQAAQAAARQQPVIEPPLFEHAAAIAYRVAGREDLRVPRAMGVAVWLLGAFVTCLGTLVLKETWQRASRGCAGLSPTRRSPPSAAGSEGQPQPAKPDRGRPQYLNAGFSRYCFRVIPF